MEVRRATPADYGDCLALDTTVTTSLVWQMEEWSSAERFAVEFRLSRLPRSVAVGLTRDGGDPLQRLAASDLLLVAQDERIRGYLKAAQRHCLAWLEELVVEPDSRRKGVATSLVQGARSWARERGLRALMAEVPARHQPIISLLQKCGFAFCGFDDHRYDGRDIVILFALKV